MLSHDTVGHNIFFVIYYIVLALKTLFWSGFDLICLISYKVSGHLYWYIDGT